MRSRAPKELKKSPPLLGPFFAQLVAKCLQRAAAAKRLSERTHVLGHQAPPPPPPLGSHLQHRS